MNMPMTPNNDVYLGYIRLFIFFLLIVHINFIIITHSFVTVIFLHSFSLLFGCKCFPHGLSLLWGKMIFLIISELFFKFSK